jgi:hypothetical protein
VDKKVDKEFKSLAIVMGYNIEVSFDLNKHQNVTEYEQEIIQTAKNYDCNHFYQLYEFEKNLCLNRNHSVINAHFDNVEQFTQFIKKIKQIKGLYIESIYNETTMKPDLLYASSYYLTTMDKHFSKCYKKNKRERSYSEDETIILNSITPTKSNQTKQNQNKT